MPFVAEARRAIEASPEACVEQLRDFPSWRVWMPSAFRRRKLEVGDGFRVKIAGVPGVASLRVTEVIAWRAVAWTGGVPGVLHAVHRFRFEPREGGAMSHSEETWSGALANVGFVEGRVKAMAERIGRDQLDALAEALRTVHVAS
jgi:hypothetical protein